MKTIKKEIRQVLHDDTCKTYKLLVVSPKKLRKMLRSKLLVESGYRLYAGWGYIDEFSAYISILYDENTTVDESSIYVIRSSDLRKVIPGRVCQLVDKIDGFWSINPTESEYYYGIPVIYRLFDNMSDATKFRITK